MKNKINMSFLIRRFNDLDHMTPAIITLFKNGVNVKIINLNPDFDYFNNLNYTILNKHGLKITLISDFQNQRLIWRVENSLLRLLIRLIRTIKISKINSLLFYCFYKLTNRISLRVQKFPNSYLEKFKNL